MTTPPDLPSDPALRTLWAKSPRGSALEGEPLAEHTLAVLTRLAELRRLRPHLATEIGEPHLWSRLFWAAFIHDWGKVAGGFQHQVRPDGAKWGKRHEVLSLAFVPYVADPVSEDALWIAAAIAAHHRDQQPLQEQYNVTTGSHSHLQAIRELVDEVDERALTALWRWLQACGREWADALGFQDIPFPLRQLAPETLATFRERAPGDICAALEAYYDWVERLEDRFPDDPPELGPLLLRGLLVTADHAGSAHAHPFQPVPLPAAREFLRRLEQEWSTTAHPHQAACARARGSILLMAPTGSGKTESALLWAANQREEERPAPRLFYMLPFQASMNAMQQRLERYCGQHGVGLQHGKARHTLYRRYLEREQSPAQAAWSARAEADLTRLHVPPVRVLSAYQLLKAFYRLRGYEATLADVYGGLFICDEIHVYEVERLALISAMLGCLHRLFAARFCLMSATFPTLLKKCLAEQISPLCEVVATPETQTEFQRHRVRLAEGDLLGSDGLRQIQQAAQQGLSILVCCNTVARAQLALERLKELGLRPELLHSRFNAQDRLRKERALQERMGTRIPCSDRRVVMVATQVVEVSLDIDFDTLFTDPAPLDALVQRFGRINRGRQAAFREITVFSEPIHHERPYDEALIRGALAVLRQEFGSEGTLLDESRVNGWLDEIYIGPLAQAWQQRYRRARQEFEETILDRLYPFQSDDGLEALFYQTFDGIEVLPQSLLMDYQRRYEEHPLAASELLVPIRWKQFERLRRSGAVLDWLQPDGIPVVARPYTATRGLEL